MNELNPVLVKELRGRMRGARAFVLLTVFLALLSGATMLFYAVIAGQMGSNPNAGREIGQALFLMVGFASLVGVSIITPVLTAGSLAGERERQTFDLLIASQLSPWQIVLGKLGSALAFAMVIVISVVPLMSVAFLFGGVSFTEVLIAIVGLATTAVFYAAIGIFWSAMMGSTLGASSLAIGTVAVKLLGIPFLALLVSIASFSGNIWGDSAALVWLALTVISIHPFFALGLTEAALQADEGVFLVNVPLNDGTQIQVLSPWIMFVILAAVCTVALLLLAVSKVSSERGGEGQRRAKPRRAAKLADGV